MQEVEGSGVDRRAPRELPGTRRGRNGKDQGWAGRQGGEERVRQRRRTECRVRRADRWGAGGRGGLAGSMAARGARELGRCGSMIRAFAGEARHPRGSQRGNERERRNPHEPASRAASIRTRAIDPLDHLVLPYLRRQMLMLPLDQGEVCRERIARARGGNPPPPLRLSDSGVASNIIPPRGSGMQ